MKHTGTVHQHNKEYPTMDVGGSSTTTIAICPPNKGQVQVIEPKQDTASTNIIAAHQSPVNAIAVSPCGTFIATASKTGTLVRIFDRAGHTIHELRRGAENADIYSLAFAADASKIVCVSDSSTVHLFALTSPNRSSVLMPFSSYIPKYFSSDWSIASVTLPTAARCVLGFLGDGRVGCITADGGFYRLGFTKGNGEVESYNQFLDLE
jgi:WD repeat-containing protein 45